MSNEQRSPVTVAALLLGVGLGGFFDGILLHQILQWHNMLSSRIPPIDLISMKYNMVWDGLFHAVTWMTTVTGVALLWRAGSNHAAAWSTRLLTGGLILGWGLFNFVEGIIDHELLGIHHVHPGSAELAWDIGFLLVGAAQIAVGALLIRRGKESKTKAIGRRPLNA